LLIIQCRACGRRVREADAEWDEVSASGQCPGCHVSFDAERESRAEEISRDPGFVRQNTRKRLLAAFSGVPITALGIGLELLHFGRLAHPVVGLGLALLAGAILLNPRRIARQDAAAPLNVDQYARKGEPDERG